MATEAIANQAALIVGLIAQLAVRWPSARKDAEEIRQAAFRLMDMLEEGNVGEAQ